MGYEINKTELRLMPYIQNVMVNSQKLDICKINQEERYLPNGEMLNILKVVQVE